MSKYFLFLFIILQFSCKKKPEINGGFEATNKAKTFPTGWSFQTWDSQNIKLDSIIKNEGKYSLSIKALWKYFSPQVIENTSLIHEKGDTVELRCFMKTEKVKWGTAGIWLKLEGGTGQIALAQKQQTGTHNWAEYRIKLPYSKKATQVRFGGILDGEGKVWFDDYKLFIDGKPVKNLINILPKKAQSDTSYRSGSRINAISIESNSINNLTIVGQFWGFMKYYHPYVSSGDVNWDGQLFVLINKALKCKNYTQLSNVLERYIESLPEVGKCNNCDKEVSVKLVIPDYGDLLGGRILSKSLTNKLKNIQQNRNNKENYWVKKNQAKVTIFTNERSYDEMVYPDAGYRLLSLFRYWSTINYYSPYRNLTRTNWNLVLKDFIPQFIAAKNKKEYTLTTLKLIGKLNDTHANFFYFNPVLESIKGTNVTPFQAEFIQDKLVVTGYYADTLGIKKKIKIGDIIVSIKNEKVDKLVKKYLPLIPASNYETQLRDLPSDFLLRSNDKKIQIVISRAKKNIVVNIPLVNSKLIYQNTDSTPAKAYYLIHDNIGYINAGEYKKSQFEQIKKMFLKTKGIIIDLRFYNSGSSMDFSLSNYIKAAESPFVKIYNPDFTLPGSFILTDTYRNGSPPSSSSINTYHYGLKTINDTYKGKVIIIVNSNTQSSGEFWAMAFQSSPNVKVIGSQTAGADGDVTGIVLPGGIHSLISAVGIMYPDNSPSQGVGVKIDHIIKPTISGIINKKDEFLEQAINILNMSGN